MCGVFVQICSRTPYRVRGLKYGTCDSEEMLKGRTLVGVRGLKCRLRSLRRNLRRSCPLWGEKTGVNFTLVFLLINQVIGK